MSAYRACNGVIRAGDPPVAVAEVTSWSLEESANTKSYFKLGTCDEQVVAGGITRNLSLEANYDPADAGQDEINLIGQTVEVEVYPIGDATGNEVFNATGVVESVTRSGSGDDLITMSVTIKVTSMTTGVVP